MTRIELAKILSDYLGEYVAPALLETNHEGFNTIDKWLGWEASWYVRVGHKQIVSNITMGEFVKGVKRGGEIFKIVNGDLVEVLIQDAPNKRVQPTRPAAKPKTKSQARG